MLLPAALALPAAEAAASRVPPGVSAANQYTETLPGPGGDSPADETPPGDNGSGALDRRDLARLEALGADGRAAARLAAEPATSSPAADVKSPGSHTVVGSGSVASGLDQVAGQVTGTADTGGIGLPLPLVIVAGALIAVAYAFNRRRPARPRD